MCGQKARMCFSFPEFRSPDEEKSHLLPTLPPGGKQLLRPQLAGSPTKDGVGVGGGSGGGSGRGGEDSEEAAVRLLMVMEV